MLFILLAGEPDKSAKMTEVITPILSGSAFILSAAAFVFTVIIQTKERKRNLRQTLSTSLSDIARINIEVAKLKNDNKENAAETIGMIKAYNSQRGTLISVADFLMKENKKMITDADCELMAMTYDDLGEISNAHAYWEKAIDLAPNETQKHLHQRDHAAFNFDNNREAEGRKLFETSLDRDLTGTDNDAGYLCDTYLIWAGLERDFGNTEEAERLIKEAKVQCARIRHQGKSKEMNYLIENATNRLK